jgi:hypothetical protein
MAKRTARCLILFGLAHALFTICSAAEIELRFTTIERIIAAQLFTQDGRHYVRGNPTTRCKYAYLETPHIDSDNGRLRVRARFSGRSAVNFRRAGAEYLEGFQDRGEGSGKEAAGIANGAIVLRDISVTTNTLDVVTITRRCERQERRSSSDRKNHRVQRIRRRPAEGCALQTRTGVV